MQQTIEQINNELERFLESTPITIHHIGEGKIIVGVARGFVRKADKVFGKKTVFDLLCMLEENPQLLDV